MSPSERQKRSRPRQSDIARAVGVSQATVSMVMSGRNVSRISPETRRKILECSGSMEYTANPAARRLAGGTNRILGVFTYEATFPIAGFNQYYPFLLGIEARAESLSQNLLLFTSAVNENGARSVYANGVNQLAIADGSILLGTDEDRSEIARLANEDYPFVYIGRRDVEARFSWVTADYAQATYDVVRRLSGDGHRSLLYLGWEEPQEAQADRFAGWTRAVADFGIAAEVKRVRTDAAIDPAVLQALHDDATGLIVEVPAMAEAVFTALFHAGLKVPADVSVAVLGDMDTPERAKNQWSGFSMPYREMATAAVDHLVGLISGTEETTQLKMPCQPKQGRTIAPARDL